MKVEILQCPSNVMDYRPGQKEAIDTILRAVSENKRVVLLESPVGLGKSLVLAMAGNHLNRTLGWSGYYTTPQVNLVEQLRHDPLLKSMIQPVVGSDNYPCVRHKPPNKNVLSVAMGWCKVGTLCRDCRGTGNVRKGLTCANCGGTGNFSYKKPKDCPDYGICPYFVDRDRAAAGPVATMTASYLLKVTANSTKRKDGDDVKTLFSPRKFLFVDEGHDLGDYATTLSFILHRKRINDPYWQNLWDEELSRLIAPDDAHFAQAESDEIYTILIRTRDVLNRVIDAEVRSLFIGDKEWLVRNKKILSWKNLSERLSDAAADVRSGNPWVAQKDEPGQKLTLSPVKSDQLLQSRLWPLGSDLIVISSATILDPEHFLRDIGLPTDSYIHENTPNIFPPQSCPVYITPSIDMTRRGQQDNLPRAMELITAILDRHPTERGIIHTVSYQLQEWIKKTIPACYKERMVFHEREGRNDTLAEWKENSQPNSVLVAVAMEEGLDLKYDLARFQIVLKCPWGQLGDRRVQKRKALSDGPYWYRLQALRTLLQSFGRIMRAEDDYGVTYVIDHSAVRLLQENWQIVPKWAKERIMDTNWQNLPIITEDHYEVYETMVWPDRS
jgi:Rad3-related DNA helicase